MTIKIFVGDVLAGLDLLGDESVHCVVTSPPYWGLRDYGVSGQIGLEPTLGEHIAKMVEVFREVRRVLRKDGTLWLNYGDCYATSPNGRSAAATKATGNDDRTFRDKPFSTIGPIYAPSSSDPFRRDTGRRGGGRNQDPSLKAKDLCMVPNRLAIALQEDGWWVRSEIIWHKPNPMPESIKDRPGSSHEKIWLLSRSERYFYDAESVKEPVATATKERLAQNVAAQEGSARQPGKTNGTMKAVGDGKTRNLRNVWTISPKGFKGAHFATFPPALIEPCIKAGCPIGGTVLDPFGGAGTTAVVAESLGRDSILIELNPAYAELTRERLRGGESSVVKDKQALGHRRYAGFNDRYFGKTPSYKEVFGF